MGFNMSAFGPAFDRLRQGGFTGGAGGNPTGGIQASPIQEMTAPPAGMTPETQGGFIGPMLGRGINPSPMAQAPMGRGAGWAGNMAGKFKQGFGLGNGGVSNKKPGMAGKAKRAMGLGMF
jgi:hypothetical protein